MARDMYRLYVHIGSSQFLVLIDPNASIEELKSEIFLIHNKCCPGCNLPNVSVIMTLCDQNGYRLASHYKVSSAIDDSAVLFAITDQYGATCSQRNMGAQDQPDRIKTNVLPGLSSSTSGCPALTSWMGPIEGSLRFKFEGTSKPVVCTVPTCSSSAYRKRRLERFKKRNNKKLKRSTTQGTFPSDGDSAAASDHSVPEATTIGVDCGALSAMTVKPKPLAECSQPASSSSGVSDCDNIGKPDLIGHKVKEKLLDTVAGHSPLCGTIQSKLNNEHCSLTMPIHLSNNSKQENSTKRKANSSRTKVKNSSELSSKPAVTLVSSETQLPATDAKHVDVKKVLRSGPYTYTKGILPTDTSDYTSDSDGGVPSVPKQTSNKASLKAPKNTGKTRPPRTKNVIKSHASDTSGESTDSEDDGSNVTPGSVKFATVNGKATLSKSKVEKNAYKSSTTSAKHTASSPKSVTHANRILSSELSEYATESIGSTSAKSADMKANDVPANTKEIQLHGEKADVNRTINPDGFTLGQLSLSLHERLQTKKIASTDDSCAKLVKDATCKSAKSLLVETSDHASSDSESALFDEQVHKEVQFSNVKVLLPETKSSDNSLVTSEQNSNMNSVTCTSSMDNATKNLCSGSEQLCAKVSEQSHMQDVRQNDAKNSAPDVLVEETQRISETQLAHVPSPEFPLGNDVDKELEDDEGKEVKKKFVSPLLRKTGPIKQRNKRGKGGELSQPANKDSCNTTAKLLVIKKESIAGREAATAHSEQVEGLSAARPKKIKTAKGRGKVNAKPLEICGTAESVIGSTAAQVSNGIIDHTTVRQNGSSNFDATTEHNNAVGCDGARADPFIFVDDASLESPAPIKLKRTSNTVFEDSASDMDYSVDHPGNGLAHLVEDALKCTPRYKKPSSSDRLSLKTPAGVKLSSALFSNTPGASTIKTGKPVSLEKKATSTTISRLASSSTRVLPEHRFNINQLSQEEIKFSQDASENLQKVFNNELWQWQS